MALGYARPDAALTRHSVWRTVAILAIAIAVVLAALVLAGWLLSRVSLASDATALARLQTRPLAGRVERVQAWSADGRVIPLQIRAGRLLPLDRLKPGEEVSVRVRVRRPGSIAWLLGTEQIEHLTVRTPVVQAAQRWLTLAPGRPLQLRFASSVSAVAYGTADHLRVHGLSHPATEVSLGDQVAAGSLDVAAAARPWETLGPPVSVSWFPPSAHPVLAALPAIGASTTPAGSISLTFSQPIAQALGGARPRVVPAVQGSWHEADSHTLVFTPSGFGAPMGSELRIELPRAVAVSSGNTLRTTSQLAWPVPPGSTLRLQQLLADTGYLPLVWHPDGAHVAANPAAQVRAAVEPPAGHFTWRYPDTPSQLQALWAPGQENEITRAAIMKFENLHEMTVDGEAGPQVWRALIGTALAGHRLSEPYSYVYVHREVPETATLWSAGRTVITTPANTGIAGAETALGTYPVFEHIPEGTMSGTNPDGSHYEDPGIKWISYFNGGDALHNFDRASFGTPQSLGCVELPLAAAAEIWKYTPIGTLVTIET